MIRVGAASRDVRIARNELRARLGTGSRKAGQRVNLSGPDAVTRVFRRSEIRRSIGRYVAERGRRWTLQRDLVECPADLAVLRVYADEIAHELASAIPSGRWKGGPGYHVQDAKDDGSVRDLVFPSVLDAIVAVRLVDAVESGVTSTDERVFVPRRHGAGATPESPYPTGSHAWARFEQSVQQAARQHGCVVALDVQDFFATLDTDLARQVLAQRTGADPQFVDLVFHSLESWLPTTRYRRAAGLPVEPNDLSRLVAHLALTAVDERFPDEHDAAYRRFMDDTYLFANDEQALTRLRVRHERALTDMGLRHNPSKSKEFRSGASIEAAWLLEDRARLEDVPFGEGLRMEKHLKRAAWTRAEAPSGAQARLWKRAYGRAAGASVPTLNDRASEHMSLPSLRDAALDYIARRPMGQERLDELTTWYTGPTRRPGDKIAAARCLLDAPLESGVDVVGLVDWAIDRVREDPTDLGEGHALGLLALLVYKQGSDDNAAAVLSADRARLGDPMLRVALQLVAHATGRMDQPACAPLRAARSSHEAWVARLCQDCVGGVVPTLDVLRACRQVQRGRPHLLIRGDLLPLLRLAARSTTPDEAPAVVSWLEDTLTLLRRSEVQDPAVLRHLQRAVSIVGGPRDTA